jgi:hypothetical protein
MTKDSNPTQVITAREKALYAAMLTLDYRVLDEILSDNLSYVHSSGVAETREEYVAALRFGRYEYGAISRVSGGTRMLNGVAITSGVIDMLVGAEGSAKNTIRLRDVLVWAKEGETWRLLLRQATRIL